MPDEASAHDSRIARLSAWVRRRLVWLLVGSYALAWLAPGPGAWLRDLGNGESVTPIRFSLVMVAILLLCGAASVELSKLRELTRRPGAVLLALLGVWVPAALVVIGWGLALRGLLNPSDAASLAVGLALAAAMPVANSAVAWTHQSGGSLAWALGLVVISIAVCPWVTPTVLGLMGLTFSGGEAAQADLVVSRFTGAIFFIWVIGPTLAGFALRAIAGANRVTAWRSGLTLLSAGALLLLNYANAAGSLPSVLGEPNGVLLLTTLVAAATLPLATALPAWGLARLSGVGHPARTAWGYSLGMKHTGLALGLAGATLGERPVAVLAILAVTLTQHAVAGAMHTLGRRFLRDDHPGPRSSVR